MINLNLVKPVSWLLAKLGWKFYSSRDPEYKIFRWSFYRTNANSFDGRYDHGPVKEGKQKLVNVSSESYWFSKPTRRLAAVWEIHSDRRSLKIRLGLPFICMHYLRFSWNKECWFAKYLRGKYPNNRAYGLTINNYALEWEWDKDVDNWCSDGSTGFHFYFPWSRFRECPECVLKIHWSQFHKFTQPSYGSRPATDHNMTVEYAEIQVKYKRFWNKRRNGPQFQANIDFPSGCKPPAFGGKGESGWDCGDDGIYGVSIKVPIELALLESLDKGVGREEILKYVTNKYMNMVHDNRKKWG